MKIDDSFEMEFHERYNRYRALGRVELETLLNFTHKTGDHPDPMSRLVINRILSVLPGRLPKKDLKTKGRSQ